MAVQKQHLKDITKKLVIVLTILLVVGFVYYPSLNNGFINVDDEPYIVNNELLKKLSSENFIEFLKEPVAANFHPLTMLSIATDYNLHGLNPFYYHLHNLIIHLLNTALVFVLIYLLSKKNIFVAAFTAIIFGIHPMHVESVAWISERKDVLYTFFFLAACIIYLWKAETLKRNIIIAILFSLSCLAKSAAVVFPLVLLLFDYYLNGRIKQKDFINKIPLLVISLIVGIIALNTQEQAIVETRTNEDKIIFASYGFVMYLVKFVIPYKLNNLYLSPIPIPEYLKLFIPLAIFISIFVFIRFIKNHKNYLFFGILFFMITIFLVLQIISFGNALMSERYTYIPYIGLTFSIAMLINEKLLSLRKNIPLKIITYIFIIAFISVNSVIAQNRTKVWSDNETLWKDAIEKDPENYIAYNNLGQLYFEDSLYNEAITCFSEAISNNNNYKLALDNRGHVYFLQNDFESALNDYEKSLELDFNDEDIQSQRQLCLDELNQIEISDGTSDLQTEIKFNSERAQSNFRIGNYREAIYYFQIVDSLDADINVNTKFNIGLCYYYLRDYNSSIPYFSEVIKNDFTNLTSFYMRGSAYMQIPDYEKALLDFSRTIQLNPNHVEALKNRAFIYYSREEYDKAIKDYTSLIFINNYSGEAYYNRCIAYYNLKDYRRALDDGLRAKELGYNVDDSFISKVRNLTNIYQ